MKTMKTTLVDAHDIRPLHPAEDEALYYRLVASMEKTGWQGRAVLAVEDEDGELQALTGSHRIMAARWAVVEVPVYVVSMTAEQREVAETGFQDERLATVRATGDADAIALFEREMKEGR